jgi:hypothetical protein
VVAALPPLLDRRSGDDRRQDPAGSPGDVGSPLDHDVYLGLLRSAADAGANALTRAEARGYQRGKDDAKTAAPVDADPLVLWKADKLRATVEAFTAATGLDLTALDRYAAADVGRALTIARNHRLASIATNAATMTAERMRSLADDLDRLHAALTDPILDDVTA